MGTFGQRLRTLRQSKGLSLQQVADLVGVSNQTVSAWENDKIFPTRKKLEKIAEAFGVTVQFLHGEESPKMPDGYVMIERSKLDAIEAENTYLKKILKLEQELAKAKNIEDVPEPKQLALTTITK